MEKQVDDTLNRITEKMKGVSEKLTKEFGASIPMLTKMAEEYQNLQKPKDKKVVKINNEEILVSLLSNGKVVFDFNTLNSSEKYFKSLK